MKILYITNGIHGAGGLERVLSVKASYLADVLGHEVHIVVLNNKGASLFYTFSAKIQLHHVVVFGNPISYVWQYINGMRDMVAALKPDVISVCDDGLKGFFLPLLLPKIPIIYERHVSKQMAFGVNPSFLKRIRVGMQLQLMNRLGRTFDKFVVLTQDNVQEWNLPNTVVIPNPLSFYPETQSALTNKTVIAVGKHTHQKGFDRLLQCWATIIKTNPDWTLEIYGKADENQRMFQLARQLQIENNLRFFEPVPDIATRFLAASVFAFSSRFEGFGMVLIEAMACGVPCVSFDCPCGPKDIICSDEDGFLVANNNTDAFTQKLLQLIENQDLRHKMGAQAKINVQRYLPEVVVKQWDELFRSLCS
ncbi:MAG: glycosyltransferase family 4 protein [Flavobacterium sp.]|nr:glycosyltransferase family 4 protein [Flavobacterium sp.]